MMRDAILQSERKINETARLVPSNNAEPVIFAGMRGHFNADADLWIYGLRSVAKSRAVGNLSSVHSA
jgi:hypothetical protein